MIKRKDKIMITAFDLFGQSGTSGITTKALAEKQGVTEPTLYRQFKNKEAILLGMIETYFSYDDAIIHTIKEQKMSLHDAVIYYVKCYAEYYENYFEVALILFSMDLYQYKDDLNSVMHKGLDHRRHLLESLLSMYDCVDDEVFLCSLIESMLQGDVFNWLRHGRDGSIIDITKITIEKILKGLGIEDEDFNS